MIGGPCSSSVAVTKAVKPEMSASTRKPCLAMPPWLVRRGPSTSSVAAVVAIAVVPLTSLMVSLHSFHE